MREVIATSEAPSAIGPYFAGDSGGGDDFYFGAGGGRLIRLRQQVVAGDVGAQTERVLRNLDAILRAAGSSLGKVVRCTVFLKNMGDFAAMNEVYGKYFEELRQRGLRWRWRGFRGKCWWRLMRLRWLEGWSVRRG